MKSSNCVLPPGRIAPRILPVCGFLAATALSLDAAIVNRWSFNAPAGDAPTGTAVANEVGGGAEAVVLGAGASMTGRAVTIPGGASASAAYVDLPNGLVSGLSECTIEGWVVVNVAGNNWGRIFDFGDSGPTTPTGAGEGEVVGPGGGGEGWDYLALAGCRGTDYNVQRLEWRNLTPGPSGTSAQVTFDSGLPTTIGQLIHYAVTVAPDGVGGSIVNYWRDGQHMTMDGSAPSFVLADLNDVNNWLGRSNWTGDANIAASFDEFRIYDTALDGTMIEESRLAGPDAGLPDADGDGMPDWYENQHPSFLNPANAADAGQDADSDGLTNLGEFQRGTDPEDTDTDNDTLLDGAEVNTHMTNPTLADTDGDALPDGQEITLTTDPNDPDSDDDGFPDGVEVNSGTDPKSAVSVPLLLLANRYGFDEASGSDTRVVPDATGEAPGAILGDGFSWNGTELLLPGGSGDTQAYVDLPSGLISRHARANGGPGTLTIEGWVTVTDSSHNWARIFDFGSSMPTNLEITGPGNTNGGSVEGRDYLMFSAYNGTDSLNRQIDWRNEDPHRGGGVVGAYPTDTFGSQFHFVITVDEITKKVRAYEDGTQKAEMNITWNIENLNDINCWLGRSNWTGDANVAGNFNEFRIYTGLMSPMKIAENTAAGPTVVPDHDTDDDGIPDWYEVRNGLNRSSAADAASDTDGDGLTALQEFQRGSKPSAVDTDGDGLGDAVETNTGIFVGAANTGSNPARADTDRDGATDGAEVTAGSNPLLYDTDGDTVSDGAEIAQGTNPASAGPEFPPLAHRWAFNEPAGPADDGATSPDLVGNEQATIRGAGAQFTGSSIQIPGGASNSAAYVDLVNGLFSSRRHLSVEGWYTVDNSGNNWGYVFGFGDSLGMELPGPGGGGEGTDYFALSASRGTNYDQQRLEWRDESPAGGGIVTWDSDVITPVSTGELIHFVVTVDNMFQDSTIYQYWRDGELRTTNAAFWGNMSELHDVNNWLGRSAWTGDQNLAGSFEEFRVYDGVLNSEAVLANFAAGPDAPPGSVPANFFITSVTRDSGTGAITLVWTSEPGKTYAVEQSLLLNAWTELAPTIPSGGATTTTTVTPPGGTTAIHYRIKRL